MFRSRSLGRLVPLSLASLLLASCAASDGDPSARGEDDAPGAVAARTSALTGSVALPEATTTAALRRQVAEAKHDETVRFEVLFDDGLDDIQAVEIVLGTGAHPLEQSLRFGGVLLGEGTPAAVAQLASSDGVRVVSDVPPPAVTRFEVVTSDKPEHTASNADSRDASNADAVSPGGALGLELSGEGVVLGVVDEGPIRTSHIDFEGRARYIDPDGSFSSHATHVTGTMIGAGIGRDDAAGFAPAARAFGWNFSRDTIDLLSRVNFRFLASNHSYGYDLGWDRNGRWVGDEGFGKYTLDARRADEAIGLFDIIWVKAAGNDRGDGAESATEFRPSDCSTGFDCISGAGVAKNMLTIAAARDLASTPAEPGDASATGFSSRGPADDGRIKPDLAANGDSLLSTAHTADDGYVRLSGTSMAAPSVTGAIGLIAEHYRDVLGRDPGAAELRALLIHTALWNDDVGRPNPVLGWGLMDVRAAVELVTADAAEGRILHGVYAGSPRSFTLTPTAGEDVAVTIAWLDPPGEVNTGDRDDTTPALVNDLDLRASHAGETWYPWRFDVANRAAPALADGPNHVDNLERIVIPGDSVTGAPVTLTLDHTGVIDDGTQAFVVIGSHPITAASSEGLFGVQRVIRLRASNDADPIDVDLPTALLAGSSADFTVALVDAPFWLSLATGEGTIPDETPSVRIDPRGLSPSLHYGTLRVDNTSTPGAPPHYVTFVLDVRGLEYPEVSAGDDLRVPSGALVTLRGSGRDPAGDPVTFLWDQVAGPDVSFDDATEARARFVAPDVDEETTLRFTLVASNGALDSAPSAVDVLVVPTSGPNEPADNRCATAATVPLPYSGAGVLDPRHDVDFLRVELAAGETVTARTFRRGSAIDTTLGAIDAAGEVLETDDDSGADLYSTLTYTAEADGALCIAVSTYSDFAFDGSAAATGGEYGLTIEIDRPNVAPTADAGDDVVATGGAVVALDGTGSTDPDGFTLGYAWTQTAGPDVDLSAADSPEPRFFAPAADEELSLTFQLEVFDADGERDDDSVTVTVAPSIPTAPIADAGGRRVVPEGAAVTLAGRGLPVADEALAFAWSQTAGPDVELAGTDTDTIAFVAPSVDVETTLEITLRVTGDVESAPDTAQVVVVPTEGVDEPENNRCDTAPLLGRSALVPVRETIAGELAPQHDVDLYRVDVLEGSVIDFEVSQNGPRIDTTMGLFRATEDGWELRLEDDDGGDGTFSRISGTSGSDGQLCIAVSHFRDFAFDGAAADGAGPYLLSIEVTPPEGANNPPVADAGDDVTVDPGALVFLDGTASSDPEGEPLDYTWRLVSGPRSVDIFDSLSDEAQVIVPNDLESEGVFVFELTVFDGAFDDAATVAVTVGPNRRPAITPIDRIEVDVGEPVAFTVEATDPDGDEVIFVADELPPGSSFDAETATFTWDADRGGFYTPRIEARDPFGAFDELFVTVLVVDRASENRAPVVAPIDDIEMDSDTEPVALTFSVDASDPDGDDLGYFWQLSDRTFLGATRSVEVALGFGEYTVECFVSDGDATSRVAFDVIIRSTQAAPPVADAGYDQTLRALGEDDVAPQIALDGRRSYDPEERGALRYTWTQTTGPEIELFGASSALPSFEQPVGEGAIRFELVVSVDDGGDVVASAPSEVFVNLATDEFNARPGALIEGPSEAEPGDTLAFDATASEDPDGDVLEYFWSVEEGEATLDGATNPRVEVTFGAAEGDTWELALLTYDGLAYSRLVRRTIRRVGTAENTAPEARARLVGSPRPGSSVQLDASDSSDRDEDDLVFTWTQTSGTPQELVGAARPVADVALVGTEGELLEFEVAVSDGEATDTATVGFLLLAPTAGADAGGDAGADAGVDATGGDAGSARSRNRDGGCAAAPRTTGAIPVAIMLVGLLATRRRGGVLAPSRGGRSGRAA